MPETRVVHCKKEPYDVYIGRGRGSVWGNEFSWLPNTLATFRVANREESLARYEEWLRARPNLIERAKRELQGKVLGCWCKPLACHGDILVEVLNE